MARGARGDRLEFGGGWDDNRRRLPSLAVKPRLRSAETSEGDMAVA